MADDLNKIQTKIALLEKDAKTGEQIHQRLEVAIGKLSDCAVSLKVCLLNKSKNYLKPNKQMKISLSL